MSKSRSILILVVLAMLFSFANFDMVAATSPNPLDDGGWELVAHMSNSGGMFDGNGELMPGYSYGTFDPNPVASTPDFQRAFPVVADKILFITGDGSIWAIADYGDLRALIDARASVFSPNLAFETGVSGVISNTTGNVLSRLGVNEDPWISMEGDHSYGVYNDWIVWGENDYAGLHSALKNNHGGINVYIKAPNLQFSSDFNSGVPSKFSGVTTTVDVQDYAGLGTGSNVFGGDFLRNDTAPAQTTTLTLTNLPPHDSISLSFLLAIIDSWDGAAGTCQAGDEFNVTVDGAIIFSEAFENSTCGVQTYNPPAGVELARRADLGFSQGFHFFDSAYDMGLDPTFQNIPHTSSTLTVEWFSSGGGWQGGADESWAIDNVQVFIPNNAPTAAAGGPYSGNEGLPIAMSGASASDPDGDPLTNAWTIDSALCSFDDASALKPNLTCSDNGSYTATLEVSDGTESVSSDASVTVSNIAPTVGLVSVPTAPIDINNQPVTGVSAPFTDLGTADSHTCTVDYGDGSGPQVGTVATGVCTGLGHTYTEAGVYVVTVEVTDDDLGVGSAIATGFIVIYDPSGGFVTGGGWIDSPVNTDYQYMEVGGKASFGFVAKYKKGANVPDGNTQFQFKAGDLNFHSNSYDWLVVAGNQAMFKGEGTINGQGSYEFMITADDDDPDTFRIKIWYVDNGLDVVVYDNGAQQPLGGGSVKIHK